MAWGNPRESGFYSLHYNRYENGHGHKQRTRGVYPIPMACVYTQFLSHIYHVQKNLHNQFILEAESYPSKIPSFISPYFPLSPRMFQLENLSGTSLPVAFSNRPRALSVTFSFMLRCLAGSILPCPNFFSTASRPFKQLAFQEL